MSTRQGAIVVGVDNSPASRRALGWAAAMAVGLGKPLHLLHAMESGFTGLPPATPDEYREMRRRAAQLLAGACARVAPSVLAVSSEVVDQAPARALARASRDAVMIVLGAQGHCAVSGWLLGSVSQHVSQHAECPVVVVREQADPRARNVVVGVDGSPGDDRAIAFAIETAALGSPLVALHGWRGNRVNWGGTPARSRTAHAEKPRGSSSTRRSRCGRRSTPTSPSVGRPCPSRRPGSSPMPPNTPRSSWSELAVTG